MAQTQHTPGPWEYVPGTEHHGPYVANQWGAGDICDCYAMSNPSSFSVRNGGDCRPINHQHDEAEANARLIAAAPDMLEALQGIEHFSDAIAFRTDTLSVELRKWIEAGRAAIAKAEGSTNA